MKVKTYPEMNEKIKDLLRLGEVPIELYAAARIDELETSAIPIVWLEGVASRFREERDKYQFRTKRYEELDDEALSVDALIDAYTRGNNSYPRFEEGVKT